METVADFILGGSRITVDDDCSHDIETLAPWKKSYDQPRQHIKKQRQYFANNGPSSQGYSVSKESAYNVGDLGLIPGLERCLGEGDGYPPVFLPGQFHEQRSLAKLR